MRQSPDDVFAWAIGQIDEAYRQLGHALGWRFLMTPRSTLRDVGSMALITLNPGGSFEPADHPRASREDGSAYVVESWPDPRRPGQRLPPGQHVLQQQVQALFRFLKRDPHSTLSAYFIPFRSPRYEDLVRPDESRAFAASLWTGLLRTVRPRLIIALGDEALTGMSAALGRPAAHRRYPTGWGSVSASLVRAEGTALVGLPHLSTYKLFGRPQCLPHLVTLFGDAGGV